MLNIDREHPEYVAKKAMWRKYKDLYAGGEQFRARADSYLVRRQKEPLDVYGERLSRVFYENYLGSIIDWYAATLFRREPLLGFDGTNERGKAFFAAFAEDCDLKGTSLSDFFRRLMIEALVCGNSFALVDFPRVLRPAANRALLMTPAVRVDSICETGPPRVGGKHQTRTEDRERDLHGGSRPALLQPLTPRRRK